MSTEQRALRSITKILKYLQGENPKTIGIYADCNTKKEKDKYKLEVVSERYCNMS